MPLVQSTLFGLVPKGMKREEPKKVAPCSIPLSSFFRSYGESGPNQKRKAKPHTSRNPKFRANPQAPIGLALPQMMQSPNRRLGVCHSPQEDPPRFMEAPWAGVLFWGSTKKALSSVPIGVPFGAKD